jgi:adenylate cyclase
VPDVFISYKREDRAPVADLVRTLRSRGLDIWWDEEIRPSQPWEQTIEQALAASRAVMVCWSARSTRSENVRAEARLAYQQGKLVQTFLERCVAPLFFSERQGIDLSGWTGEATDPRISALDRALREVMQGTQILAAGGRYPAPRTADGEASIAILPFVNLSGDPQKDFIAEGLAEELIHVLSSRTRMRVSSRTSSFAYKGRNVDVRDVARDLQVENILEGSVRAQGNRLRVTGQLIDARSGFHCWSQTYDRDLTDVFELQDELATEIAESLKTTRQSGEQRENADAVALYLQARGFARRATPEGIERAIALHERAIGIAPSFARAWTGLAGTLLVGTGMGMLPIERRTEARNRAEEAIRLAPDLAPPRAIRAVLDASSARWIDADVGFSAAISLDPNEPTSLEARALNVLGPCGQLADALTVSSRAVELAPASENIALSHALFLMFAEGSWSARRQLENATLLGAPPERLLARLLRADLASDGKQNDAAVHAAAALSFGMTEYEKHVEQIASMTFRALREPSCAHSAAAKLAEFANDIARAGLLFRNPAAAGILIRWQTTLGALDEASETSRLLVAEWRRTGIVPALSLVQLWTPTMARFRAERGFQDLTRALGMFEYWQAKGPPDGYELQRDVLVSRS